MKFENANWDLCRVEPIDLYDRSYSNVISYLWWNKETYTLVVINFSSGFVKAHIKSDQINFGSNNYTFTEL